MVVIWVTGGSGYIGRNLIEYLLDRTNWKIYNLDKKPFQSTIRATNRLKSLIIDLVNWEELITEVNEIENPDLVFHLAAYKSVPESIKNPIYYYKNNINSTINLMNYLVNYTTCKSIIYSSSAAIYGNCNQNKALCETINGEGEGKDEGEGNKNWKPISPYGKTKLMCEQIIEDIVASTNIKVIALRYFNPIGGENLNNIREAPTNLIPALVNKIHNRNHNQNQNQDPTFNLYGTDYPMINNLKSNIVEDGTPIRDWVYIDDISDGHLKAAKKLLDVKERGQLKTFDVYNLGSGTGHSVKQLLYGLQTMGINFNIKECGRRPGDIYLLIADISKAKRELGYNPRYNLYKMLEKVAQNIKKL